MLRCRVEAASSMGCSQLNGEGSKDGDLPLVCRTKARSECVVRKEEKQRVSVEIAVVARARGGAMALSGN